MPFIIDGHNLIGALPDIQLSDPNDEEQLLLRLQSFTARTGKAVSIYFDQGVPGGQKNIRRGRLTAHFVSRNRTADDAIKAHVRRLERQASNWTVVSSDHDVLDFARRSGARTITSSEFAALLQPASSVSSQDEPRDYSLSSEEVLAWEELFNDKKSGGD